MAVGYDGRVLKGPTPPGPHMRILSDIYNVPLLQIHGPLTEPRSKPAELLPSACSNLVARVQNGHPTHGRRCGVRIVRDLKKQEQLPSLNTTSRPDRRSRSTSRSDLRSAGGFLDEGRVICNHGFGTNLGFPDGNCLPLHAYTWMSHMRANLRFGQVIDQS